MRVTFYLQDKNEELSLEHSVLDSSEGLLQRGKRGASVYRSFCNKDQIVGTWEDYCELKKTRHLKLRNLLIYVWVDAKSGLIKIIPLICTLAIWGQYPVFSHPESPQGTAVLGTLEGNPARASHACFLFCFGHSTWLVESGIEPKPWQ